MPQKYVVPWHSPGYWQSYALIAAPVDSHTVSCSVLISTSPTELIFTSAPLEKFALTPSASDSTSSLYGLTSPHHCKGWPSICCTDTPSMPSTLLDQVKLSSIWDSFGDLTATAHLSHTPSFFDTNIQLDLFVGYSQCECSSNSLMTVLHHPLHNSTLDVVWRTCECGPSPWHHCNLCAFFTFPSPIFTWYVGEARYCGIVTDYLFIECHWYKPAYFFSWPFYGIFSWTHALSQGLTGSCL